jgi:hypothetical protein
MRYSLEQFSSAEAAERQRLASLGVTNTDQLLERAALLLLFVVPYLILGGWARGIFYMVLLWASFALENRLTISAPTWFQLPPDSVAQGPFIAFFVFINALFFDWLFEATVERKKICPACKTELDQDSMFCARCGFQQE